MRWERPPHCPASRASAGFVFGVLCGYSPRPVLPCRLIRHFPCIVHVASPYAATRPTEGLN
jgi:hypothetical protein